MDEETCNFVEAMENHRVSPHGYRNCIITKSETEGADEEAFGLGKDPDTEEHHEVDKVAKVGQEVVVPYFAIREIPNGHEIEELKCVPDVEVFTISAYQISTNQDIQNTTYERDLFP